MTCLKALVALLPLFTSLNAQHFPSCARSMLAGIAERYIAAQSTGNPKWLLAAGVRPDSRIIENSVTKPLSQSLTLNKPLRIDRSHGIYDTASCATFVELIASDPSNPWVIGAQISVSLDTNLITKIDRVVTTTGDWLFNATHTLHWALREDWTQPYNSVQDAERAGNTRQALYDGAKAYFDAFASREVKVPWGYPCTRLEGGSFTGRGMYNDTCEVGMPTEMTIDIPDRRYVVDVVNGAVSVLATLTGLGNAPDSHEFRFVGGKIVRVHTMTFCEKKPNCGLEPPPDMINGPETDFGEPW